MENRAFGGSIGREGSPNGATWAFLIYIGVALLTMRFASRSDFFRKFGSIESRTLINPSRVNVRAFLLMFLMLMFVLYGIGGIDNYRATTNSGEFRASLGPIGGLIGGIILKYIAPSLFAFALMTNIAWDKRRVRSFVVLSLGFMMVLIGGAFGFKSSFVSAVLPAALLYYWRSSKLILVPLGMIATCVILFGYLYFTTITDIGTAFAKMIDRLFVLQGDVAWLIWDMYQKGEPLPSYSNTLLPIAGDRIASLLTGVTRENQYQWVMGHFSLMITHLSGYPVEAILGGHNNTATVFSEGILAAGPIGVVIFAVLAGVIVSLNYYFIQNKLTANDFASAAIGASYFVNGVMAWLIAGGVQVAIHISIPVLFYGTYRILCLIEGRPAGKLKMVPPLTDSHLQARQGR